VELCGYWRRLIDGNRDIIGGMGFAFWKQSHVAPLLWGGQDKFHFYRMPPKVRSGGSIAAWSAKVAPDELASLARTKLAVIEVEDGFLRSSGLGADCVPPLSITTDSLGSHFDPARPSELELLLQEGEIDPPLLARAAQLRRAIVDAGIGKYERSSGVSVPRAGGRRRHVLVPGQVEDDRAVQTGGCGLTSNLELLRRVRAEAPDAYILYKPHPDVVAGHRRGAVSEHLCLEQADAVVDDVPISALIDMADEVHVNTSLAGFEALLRETTVVTYGVPFYAGWGLTRDLGPVPARRSAARTLDELVAAALIMYPRYLDPVTGLPCPPEVVVERLTQGQTTGAGLLVFMRRLQGRVMRQLRSAVR
jgi:capsular polysaccharide export protein